MQFNNFTDSVNNGVPGEKPDIERDLVVTAARRVQFFPGIPDFFNQAGFDIHVDVFQFRFELEFAFGDFFPDFGQCFDNGFAFGHRDDALLG